MIGLVIVLLNLLILTPHNLEQMDIKANLSVVYFFKGYAWYSSK